MTIEEGPLGGTTGEVGMRTGVGMMKRFAWRKVLAVTLAIATVGSESAAAQDRPNAHSEPAHELDYGPYVAGFTVLESLDSTRAFRPLRDFRGALAAEPARPVQVSIWYPSEAALDGQSGARMLAGDFRALRASELEFDRDVGEEDRRRMRADHIGRVTSFGGDSAAAAAIWDDRLPVVRDAPPDPGPHPTLLYFTAAGVSNPVLPAYLASHGFVVASFPSNGRMTAATLEYTPNALTLDTDVDDAGFVYGLLRRLPYADSDRLAVTSFSGGSLASLLWVMRDMQAAAVVTVEGWERYRRGADIVAGSVHYEPHRVRVPYLMIERAADETSPEFAKVPDVVGALPYAGITRVAFRDASHGDFLSHAAFGHTEDQPRIFETSARMIRRFLERTIGGDAGDGPSPAPAVADMAPPDDDAFFSVERDPAVGPVPTEEELYRLAETDPDAAAAVYREAAGVVPGADLFRESALTRAAFFAPGAQARATIMRIVVDAYPASAPARFRLGEALRETGRTEEGAAELRAALEDVESDSNLDASAREEWRERIRTALEGKR